MDLKEYMPVSGTSEEKIPSLDDKKEPNCLFLKGLIKGWGAR